MRWLFVFALVGCGDDLSSTRVDVRTFGARGDGMTDDTAAIQAAIDNVDDGGTIVIPDGVYLIAVSDDAGLNVRSHRTVELASHATLRVIPNNYPTYDLVRVFGQTDVTIRGGTLLGDRDEHVLPDGYEDGHGHGITILGSTSVIVDGVTARDFWGDGFYIGPLDAPSQHIQLSNSIADSNRRQGLSITKATDIVIFNNQFDNTSGTAPEGGIDLEPNEGETVRDVQIVDNVFRNNTFGILMAQQPGSIVDNVLVSNNTIVDNRDQGVVLVGVASTVLVHRNVIRGNRVGIELTGAQDNRIEDNLIELNRGGGIALADTNRIAISGNLIHGNGDASLAFDNIELVSSSGNIVERNHIRSGGEPAVSRYGVSIAEDCVQNTVLDNDLTCAGVFSALHDLGTATRIQDNVVQVPCIDAAGSTVVSF